VEFKDHPSKLRRRDDRFLFCIYREEQLTK
jgi:hypothetical protein